MPYRATTAMEKEAMTDHVTFTRPNTREASSRGSTRADAISGGTVKSNMEVVHEESVSNEENKEYNINEVETSENRVEVDAATDDVSERRDSLILQARLEPLEIESVRSEKKINNIADENNAAEAEAEAVIGEMGDGDKIETGNQRKCKALYVNIVITSYYFYS